MAKNWIFMVLFSLGLIACNSSENSSFVAYIKDVKSRSRLPVEPRAKIESLAIFHYPEDNKRPNPFKPKLNYFDDDKSIVNTKRPKQPLEQFALESLSFVGLMRKGSITWALISRMDGLISSVQLGDYMGKNEGKIISIKEDSIQLEERVLVSGNYTKKIEELVLSSRR